MKRFLSIIISCCLVLSFTACNNQTGKSDKIYYLSTDKVGIIGVDYTFQSNQTTAMIDEAFEALSTNTSDVDYMKTIPSKIKVKEWKYFSDDVSVYFTSEYSSLDSYTEILVRAAIVKTLVQIPGVVSVSFYIDNSPLTDSDGAVVGAMTSDTFIDDFGSETNSLLSTNLKLYFASADGTSIVPEEREVYYGRNVPLEKVVVEQILKGPDTKGLLNPIPTGTMINSVSVKDGVCFVDFDRTFESPISGVTENASVYAVVSSLAELDSVNQVQILVNGEIPHLTTFDGDLSNSLTVNNEIINNSLIEEEDSSWEEESEF